MKKIKEKYKLILSWDSIEVIDDNHALVFGARFSGPALKLATSLNAEDSIDLDLTSQHIDLIGTWDIVTFEWSGIKYVEDGSTVFFSRGRLRSPELGKVRNFKNSDRVVIDTEDHEEEKHPLNLVYRAYIEREDSTPYDYKR